MIIYAGMCKGRRSIDGDFPARASYGVFKSTNGGLSWDTVNTGLPTSLLNIHCIAVQENNADVAYVGTWRDGVYKTINGGLTWTISNSGLTSSDIRSLTIHPNDTLTVFAGSGDGGGLFKSSNGGTSWSPVNTGLTLSCPPYLSPIGRVTQGISFDTPPRFGPRPDYYPAAWTSIRAIAIDPANPDNVYAADYKTGVYASTDGGGSWNAMNDSLTMRTVNAMAISSDGNLLYAATFGGGVFRLPLNSNHEPKIASANPPTGAVLTLDQIDTTDLCVSAYDLDGDQLSYVWLVDGTDWPGSDACLIVAGADFLPGYHVFEVRVSDSDTAVSVFWEADVLSDVSDDGGSSNLPKEYALSQNHPNPFNPSTVIAYALPTRSDVKIEIFNILGRLVTTLVDSNKPAGSHEVIWDGTDLSGKQVATGVYLYRLKAGETVLTRKMLLLK
jgi:photosystem II stability/assembly factor-like uncharacterized protein